LLFQAEDGIRDDLVTGVQTCALPISLESSAGGTPQSSDGRTPGLQQRPTRSARHRRENSGPWVRVSVRSEILGFLCRRTTAQSDYQSQPSVAVAPSFGHGTEETESAREAGAD